MTATIEKIYSRDRNLWHLSHEGGGLEDPELGADRGCVPAHDPSGAALPTSRSASRSGSTQGTPVSVNGAALDPVALIATLNQIGGRHGVGRVDLVEDRLVGMKSRGVYETPGGTLLYTAHSELEQLTLDRRTLAAKD